MNKENCALKLVDEILPVLSYFYTCGGCIQTSVSSPYDSKRSCIDAPCELYDTRQCSVLKFIESVR